MPSCCKEPRTHIHTDEGIVFLYGERDFDGMRKAGHLAACTLDYIEPFIKAGVTTEKLDQLCDTFIRDHGAIPAPLNYKGFPKSICTSVNHVVCHGIPGNQMLKTSDILNIDVTVILDGWYGDTSRMFWVDPIPARTKKLLDITKKSLETAINIVRPGCFLGDIGACIQSIAQAHHFSVVEDYCGHGIGHFFHGAPSVLHIGQEGQGLELQKGMIFTIEPMINMGTARTKLLADGWTVVTKDKGLSAQYEHTIGVTENGFEIFTLSNSGK